MTAILDAFVFILCAVAIVSAVAILWKAVLVKRRERARQKRSRTLEH